MKQSSVSSSSSSSISSVRIYCCTWNVGNESPDETDLEQMLPLSSSASTSNGTSNDSSSSTSPLHDIYAIGVQECQYQYPSMEEGADSTLTCEAHWFGALEKHFEKHGFRPLAQASIPDMVIVDEDKSDNAKDALERQYTDALTQHGATGPGEIRLSIFCKCSLPVTNVRTTTISCGRFNNLNSNKGAVATLFSIQGRDICILNCHLNAHRPKWERRNRDMTAILRQLASFSMDADDSELEIDLLVCLGDLNYRVDLEIDQILDCVQTKDWAMMLNHDQLKLQQTQQRILHDFQEAPIHFPPTFKCTKGSVVDYDVTQREPSYCDRILWRCSKHTSCLVHRYISFPQITTSDHKPVVAELEFMLQPHQEPRIMSRWYHRILNHMAVSSIIEVRWGIILMSCVTGGVAVGTAVLLSKYSTASKKYS